MNARTAPKQFQHSEWDVSDLTDRVEHATAVLWNVENLNVIHLSKAGNTPLRSLLQSLGLEVTNGANCVEQSDPAPVITVCASEWTKGDLRTAVNIVQAAYPESIVCILSGFANRDTSDTDGPVYSDARALFVATGMNFFSWGGNI